MFKKYKLNWEIAYLRNDCTWHHERRGRDGDTKFFWWVGLENRKNITEFTQSIALKYSEGTGGVTREGWHYPHKHDWEEAQQIDNYKKIKFSMQSLIEEKYLFGIPLLRVPDINSKGHSIAWSLTFDYEDNSRNKVHPANCIWYPDNGGRLDGDTELVVPIPEDHNWEYFIFSFDSYD